MNKEDLNNITVTNDNVANLAEIAINLKLSADNLLNLLLIKSGNSC